MTKTLTAVVGVLALAASGVAGTADARVRTNDPALIKAQYGRCYTGERAGECRNRLAYQRDHHRNFVWRNGRYYYERHGDDDAAAAALFGGVLGFALGTAVVGSQADHDYYYARRNDRAWLDYCHDHYHGFDRGTGTYMGDDGYRRYCR